MSERKKTSHSTQLSDQEVWELAQEKLGSKATPSNEAPKRVPQERTIVDPVTGKKYRGIDTNGHPLFEAAEFIKRSGVARPSKSGPKRAPTNRQD